MKICYWGTYDREYPRNKILISGLKKNKAEVVECNVKIWRDTAEKMAAASSGWANLKILHRWFFAYLLLIRRFAAIKDVDVLFIGYSGHFDVFVAFILCKMRKVPMVFDAFLSLYDSLVFDRKVVKKDSLKAAFLYYLDKYACRLADLVLLDTDQHIDYFVPQFNLPKEKFQRIFIGADDAVFSPMEGEVKESPFTVIHFGKYIPLHGMPFIIKAAKELEGYDVRFQLIGSGDEFEASLKLSEDLGLKNVEFIEFLEYEKLKAYIRNADVCLGIFGKTDKAGRVVPNKVYEAMAMKKPVITGDSLAAGEILRHKENAFLCKMGAPHAIAEAVLALKKDERLCRNIAEGGYATYKRFCSPSALGRELKSLLIRESKKR